MCEKAFQLQFVTLTSGDQSAAVTLFSAEDWLAAKHNGRTFLQVRLVAGRLEILAWADPQQSAPTYQGEIETGGA
jgi:hypothetical protein